MRGRWHCRWVCWRRCRCCEARTSKRDRPLAAKHAGELLALALHELGPGFVASFGHGLTGLFAALKKGVGLLAALPALQSRDE
jgi:hypothetical protein